MIFCGYFGNFVGFGGILVICRFRRYFGNFKVSGVFWTFFRFEGVFWLFFKLWGYFGHFFWVLGSFGHFLGFEVILVIF